MKSLLAILLAVSPMVLGQPTIPEVRGTWRVTTTSSLSATLQVLQQADVVSGQLIFTGTQCANIAQFAGSISTLSAPTMHLSVDMSGQNVSFTGTIDPGGTSIRGVYGGSGGGCIGRGPFNWIATRTSTLISPTITGVRHAASGAPGPISPGEIISIFANASVGPIGPRPGVSLRLDESGKVATSLDGVRVRFVEVDTHAPLTYVSAGQINAVVPYEVSGLTSVRLQVEYSSMLSDPITMQLAATAPGVFTANGTGSGPGAILNHDGATLNGPTKAEPRGGHITLFLTGGGQTRPAGVSGKVTTVSEVPPITPTPLAPVNVNINGQPAPVMFFGEAPGLVSGVLQLNVQIPLTISPGNVPIQVIVGGKPSQSGVTVVVE